MHSKAEKLYGSVRSVNQLSVKSSLLCAPVLLHSEYPGLIPPVKDGLDPQRDLEEQVRADDHGSLTKTTDAREAKTKSNKE